MDDKAPRSKARKARANTVPAPVAPDHGVVGDVPAALAVLPGEAQLVHQYLAMLLNELFK